MGTVIRRTLVGSGCLLVFAGALRWFLLGALFGFLGIAMPLNQLLAALITLAVLAALLWLRAVQLRHELAGTMLTLSPLGIEQLDDSGNRRVLAWHQTTHAGPVRPPQRDARMIAGSTLAKAVGQIAVDGAGSAAQVLGADIGLIGVGTIEFREDGPEVRTAYLQAFGLTPEGRPLVGIAPSVFIASWPESRIGAWVGHHRPDILQQAREQIARRGFESDVPEPEAPRRGDRI